MSRHVVISGKSFLLNACPVCGTLHAFDEALYVVAKARAPDVSIFCPNGHMWHYNKPENPLPIDRADAATLRHRIMCLEQDEHAHRKKIARLERQLEKARVQK